MLNRKDFEDFIKPLLTDQKEISRREFDYLFNPEEMEEDDLDAVYEFCKDNGITIADTLSGKKNEFVDMGVYGQYAQDDSDEAETEEDSQDENDCASDEETDEDSEESVDSESKKPKKPGKKGEFGFSTEFIKQHGASFQDMMTAMKYMGNSNEQLVDMYQDGNNDVLVPLFLKNRRMIFVVAQKMKHKFYGCNMEIQDLFHDGYIGMIRAAKKYDGYKYNTEFITYAVTYMENEMREQIARSGYEISTNTTMFNRIMRIHYVAKNNPGKSMQELTDIANAGSTEHLTVEQVRNACIEFEAMCECGHLEQPTSASDDDDLLLMDQTAAPSRTLDDMLTDKYLTDTVADHLKALSEKDREITMLGLGLLKGETVASLARKYKTDARVIHAIIRREKIALKQKLDSYGC